MWIFGILFYLFCCEISSLFWPSLPHLLLSMPSLHLCSCRINLFTRNDLNSSLFLILQDPYFLALFPVFLDQELLILPSFLQELVFLGWNYAFAEDWNVGDNKFVIKEHLFFSNFFQLLIPLVKFFDRVLTN